MASPCGHILVQLVLRTGSILAVVFAVPLQAEWEDTQLLDAYLQQTWRHEDGLPDDDVRALLETRDGYLWIGSSRGFFRFDGTHFTRFLSNNIPWIESVRCTSLCQDREENIWIGTTSGLIRFSGEEFDLFDANSGLPANEITSVEPRSSGGVWAGTASGLVEVVEGEVRVHTNADGLPDANVHCLAMDEDGTLWIGTEGGLAKYTAAGGQIEQHRLPQGYRGEGFQTDRVAALAATGGTLHVLLGRKEWESGGNWFVRDRSGWSGRGPEVYNFTRPVFLSALEGTREIWAPRRGRAFQCWRNGNFRVLEYSDTFETMMPTSLTQTRDGSIWYGAEQAGLHRLSPRRVEVKNRSTGLADDMIWATAESRQGDLIVGTRLGFNIIGNDNIDTYTMEDGLRDGRCMSLCEDALGRLWIGTNGGGLYCLINGQLFSLWLQGAREDNKIRCVLVAGNDGSIWVGTMRALHRIHARPPAMDSSRQSSDLPMMAVHSIETWSDFAGGSEIDVRQLHKDSSGILWIGTAREGLFRKNGEHFKRYTIADGLGSDSVWAFHEDAEGVLWIGTERGLNRYRNGEFALFTTTEGLPDNLVNSILEDEQGRLWIGHDRGLYRVSKRKLDDIAAGKRRRVFCVTYDEADGLPIVETNGQRNQPAAWKSRDGRLWYPTPKGLVGIDPANPPGTTSPPPVVIEQVRANGQLIFANGPTPDAVRLPGSDSAPRVLRRGPVYRLQPGTAHILEVHYTAPALSASDRTRFRYRLDGLDEGWVDAGPTRSAYYANLEPGRYRFRLLAQSKYGVSSVREAAFVFDYLPHFYQTTWFIALCGFTVAASAFGFYRWRVNLHDRIGHLEKERALLQERERIARDLHDGLGADLTQLSLLTELEHQKPIDLSEIQARLQRLSSSTRAALHSVKDVLWSAHPRNDSLESLIARICQHTERLFERLEETRCRFDLPRRIDDVPLSPDQRQNVFLLCKEALNNAAKHAGATEVIFRARSVDSVLSFLIEDNGCGFDPSATNDIPPMKTPLTGHGITNMRRRAQIIGAKLTIESAPGTGTRVTLRVALELNSA